MERRLRADVEHLAALVRDSAGPGERASAAWIARRLREEGAEAVDVEPFRYQGTYAWAHAAHAAAGLAGGWAAAAALLSLDLEASGRLQWLRRVLPAGEGANVVARLPAAPGGRRATLVLVAHHDAARTGAVWHPRIARLALRSRRRRIAGFQQPTAAGLALAALPSRRARAAGRALLAASIAADVDVARSPTVPGASDNATGVAALLWLAGQVGAPHVETLLVATGCEESGMGGMAAFLRAHGAELRAHRTLVLSLDTLGAGAPVLAAGEGTIREHRYRAADLALADAGAARAGEPPPPRWRIGGWTDPILARFAGLPAISLLSMAPGGGFTEYHRLGDTAGRVEWRSVGRCTRIAAGIAAAFAAVTV
ncbi:MAG TPA: M28 family peptidase [Solirubrobacteraceae bacterium]